jgi:uncharacterized protein (DUF2141 family)
MKKRITLIVVIFFSFFSIIAQENSTQDVIVKMINFKNNSGKVFIALHNSQSTFLVKEFMSSIVQIENNECTVTFKKVPAGTYAISLFHDENDNGKMDTNFLGIPKESYGCSNNAKGFMGPPKWEDAKFEVRNKTIIQTITL